MSIQPISRVGAAIGCCAAALALIGVVTSASSMSSAPRVATPSQSVERAGKGDFFTGSADFLAHVRGSNGGDAIAVDVTGPSDVVVRDRSGNILYAVSHATRTTTVGQQNRRSVVYPVPKMPIKRALPDGCEGAFSPYVEPEKAHVIGRCVSGLFSSRNALS